MGFEFAGDITSETEVDRLLADLDDDDGSSAVAPAAGAGPALLENMVRLWINERAAPELLPFQHNTVAALRDILEKQQDELDSREFSTPDDAFIKYVSQLELERIRFVLRSYMRIRLRKIERFSQYLVTDPEQRFKLSDAELDFAEGFQHLVGTYHRQSFLDMLPADMQALDDPEMIGRPPMKNAVFCRVNQDVGELQISPRRVRLVAAAVLILATPRLTGVCSAYSETIVMKKDQMYLLRYSSVRGLVEDGTVDLL
ncbi:GINS complex subunit [Polyrhizophydium stewartii]|uniref:DNA replication complex GINS protein SLD5 n=1 Tax=Polyrhizophydium stewartii TaxID=2732419 RepID=A0ABR4NKH7_9FUNG